MKSVWGVLVVLSILLPAEVAGQTAERPTVGLALGGGSARGLAHVGFLAWLHENRIPVNYVAGTSMGGLVGGAYAAGMDPAELAEVLRGVDWDLMFLGEPPYRQLEFRRKQDRRQLPIKVEVGLKNGFRLPSGLDPGQQVGLLLSYISLPYTSDLNFDELPTPFRAVATDMDAAEVRALESGSLSQALLATMAIPGVFPPVRIDGALLADGGMLNNVPADVVRSMGADIVIAIDVGNRETDENFDALSQASRAISVMMESATRAALQEADIVVRPDLEGFGSLDWRRSDALAERGYQAAAAISEQLLVYAVSEAEWTAFAATREAQTLQKTFTPTRLDVEGTTPALEAFIRRRLDGHLDQPLDPDALADDLTWVTGSGHFERLRYEASEKDDEDGLLVVVQEKINGPPFLRFGLDVSNEALGLDVGFKSRLIVLDAGKPSAEVRADVAIGRTLGAAVEYYWPFARTRLFFAPRAVASREFRNVFRDNELVATVRDRVAAVGGDIGFTTSHSVELRVGYQIGDVETGIEIGDPQPEVSGTEELARLRFRLDLMDAPIIPERGVRAELAADYFFEAPDAEAAFGVVEASATVFQPLSTRDRIFLAGRGGTSFANDAPFLYQLTLGGPFRLSSFDRGRFQGQRFLYGSGGYLRSIARLPDFAGGPVYVIGFAEAGSAFDDLDVAEWHGSASGGVVMETLLGPLLVAAAFGDEDSSKFYFIFGDLFR